MERHFEKPKVANILGKVNNIASKSRKTMYYNQMIIYI